MDRKVNIFNRANQKRGDTVRDCGIIMSLKIDIRNNIAIKMQGQVSKEMKQGYF